MRVMLLTEHHLGGCTGSSESTLVKPCPFLSFWLFFFFERTSDATKPNAAHVINRPCQGVKTSNHRKMGYGTRSLISDFVVQSLESIIDKLAIHTNFSILANLSN